MDTRKIAGGTLVGGSFAAFVLLMLIQCSAGGEGRTPIQKAIDEDRDRQRMAAVAARQQAAQAAQAAKQSPLPSRRGQKVTGPPASGDGDGAGQHVNGTGGGDHPH
jgi:hypothetical protein